MNNSKDDSQYLKIDNESQIDLIIIFKLMIKNVKIILGVTGLLTLVTIIWLLLQEREYTASAVLLPESNEASSGISAQLMGFASSFGFGGGTKNEKSDLYEDIVKSRNFAEKFISKKILNPDNNKEETLLEIHQKEFKTKEEQINAIRSILGSNFTLYKEQNGTLVLEYISYDPVVASIMLSSLLEELDKHNKNDENSKASENRMFIGKRLLEVTKQLDSLEQSLSVFLEENHDLNSPRVQFEFKNIQRDITICEGVYMTLSKEYELSKIKEQEDRSIIKLLDNPYSSNRPSFPKTKLTIIASIIFGGFLGMFLVYILFVFKPLNKFIKTV